MTVGSTSLSDLGAYREQFESFIMDSWLPGGEFYKNFIRMKIHTLKVYFLFISG